MIIDDLTNYIKSPNAPSIANPNSTHPQKLKLMKLLGDSYKELATTYKWKETIYKPNTIMKNLFAICKPIILL